jgi:heat shock protein HslJ
MLRRSHRLAGFSLLTVTAALAAACSAAGVSSPSSGVQTLANTAWLVTTVDGQSVDPDTPPTLVFDDAGRVSGTGGCNQYNGPYTQDGGSLTFGNLASTLMLCEGELGRQESAFLGALGGTRTWQVTPEGSLELGGASTIVAEKATQAPTPKPVATELPGTSWDLVQLGETADLARLVPTIEFGSDGTVSGFAGCNRFSGSFTTDGSTLKLGPLATTRIGCPPPASTVETDYLQALSGVTSWAVTSDGRLELGGPVRLTYTRA